jgi:cell fate (sporulation/competence/biofilm development) regulator YlbF (YheA/YmcA/DUF963 family)
MTFIDSELQKIDL